MKSKKILGGLVGLAIAGVLLFFGVKEYRSSKQLVKEGQSVDAQVTDKDTVRGRKGRRSYYVSVSFKPPTGQVVEKRLSVSSSEYDAATVGQTIAVRYLASNPQECQVGDTTRVPWTSFIAGVILAFGGGGSLLNGVSRDEEEGVTSEGTGDSASSPEVAANDAQAESFDDDEELAA